METLTEEFNANYVLAQHNQIRNFTIIQSYSEFTNTFVNSGFQGIAFWTVIIKSPVDAPKATKVEDVNSVLQDILAVL